MTDLPHPVAEADPVARIQPIDWHGRRAWLKRPERLKGRMRLQKGDPRAAFAVELRAHERLLDAGAPVPRILASGADWIVTEDAGPTLFKAIRARGPGDADVLEGLHAAARALAALHAAGLAHGRPNLKDICLDDGRIVFLDFERAGRADPATDILVFLFSVATETGADRDLMGALVASYSAAGGAPYWRRAMARVRRLRFAAPLLRAIAWAASGSLEWRAVPGMLDFLADPPPAR